MLEALDTKVKIEEAMEGHGHAASRRIGLLIAALAVLLALTDAGGKAAQTEGFNANIRASDLWAFFQAKTIRSTVLLTAVETANLNLVRETAPEARAAIQKQVDTWNATVARYESEPQTHEGRKELTERAKEAEAERDHKMAAYHLFEYGSAAAQLAIVLASAAIITGLGLLMDVAGGLGTLGLVFGLLAWLAPTLLYL